MSYLPKNAAKLLKDKKLLREYALKPFGLDIPKNSQFPKSHPPYKFFEHDLMLHRPGPSENIEPNVIVFKVKEDISKPEIKQYLEKLYHMPIEKINTARFMGKVYRKLKFHKKKNFKKAFVKTTTHIPEILNQRIQ